MFIVLLIAVLILIGLLVGALAGVIWKDPRPYGIRGDLLISAAVTVVIGLMDWYIIPAMGFSTTMRNLGVLIEPPLGALLVLWLVRRSKK